MILTEWNTEDAIAFAREEGLEDGREENAREIAKNLLSKGSTVEFVHEITGLNIKTIQELSAFTDQK